MSNVFESAYEMLINTDQDALEKSLNDVHQEGLFSLVVGGTENGQLTRIFIATKKIKPFSLQLHSHCYDLNIGVIKGTFTHHTAIECGENAKGPNIAMLDKFKYKSPLNGGNGLEYVERAPFGITTTIIPEQGEIYLDHNDIHTVSASKGAMWIVQELGFQTKESIVVGKKFITENLYNPVEQFQINDMWQKVKAALKPIVENKYV